MLILFDKLSRGYVYSRAMFIPDSRVNDLPKSGCAMAHPAHPGMTGLTSMHNAYTLGHYCKGFKNDYR